MPLEQDLVVEEGAEAGEGRGAVAEDRERLGGDDDRDAEAEAAHRRVGNAAEAAADLEGGAADLDDVADRSAELVEHQRVDERAEVLAVQARKSNGFWPNGISGLKTWPSSG